MNPGDYVLLNIPQGEFFYQIRSITPTGAIIDDITNPSNNGIVIFDPIKNKYQIEGLTIDHDIRILDPATFMQRWPTDIQLPEAKTLEDVERYLNFIIRGKLGNLYHLDLRRNNYIIPVDFDGFSTQMKISYSDPAQINISIENSLDISLPCLDLRIYNENGNLIGYLGYIRTRNTSCTIPANRPGNWLVRLANKIFCSLGIRTIKLDDDATVPCNEEEIRFSILRLYQGKNPWYQAFGYDHNFNSERIQNRYPGYNEQIFSQDVQNLVNYPVSQIYRILENFEGSVLDFRKVWGRNFDRNYIIVAEDGMKTRYVFNKYPLPPDATLGGYMSTLWDLDCRAYVTISKFLSTTSREDIDKNGTVFYWSPILRRIEFVIRDYIYTCK